MKTTVTIHHTAFRQPGEEVGTTVKVFDGTKMTGNPGSTDEVRELMFHLTNAPDEMLRPLEIMTRDSFVRTGRTPSMSVGDIIEIKDEDGHHSVAIVASSGFKTLGDARVGDGQDIESIVPTLVRASERDGVHSQRGWFDQFSRTHEVPDKILMAID